MEIKTVGRYSKDGSRSFRTGDVFKLLKVNGLSLTRLARIGGEDTFTGTKHFQPFRVMSSPYFGTIGNKSGTKQSHVPIQITCHTNYPLNQNQAIIKN